MHSDSYSWTVVFVAVVIAALSVGGFVFAPKGDNQTYPRPSWIGLILQSLAIFNNPDTRLMLFIVYSS